MWCRDDEASEQREDEQDAREAGHGGASLLGVRCPRIARGRKHGQSLGPLAGRTRTPRGTPALIQSVTPATDGVLVQIQELSIEKNLMARVSGNPRADSDQTRP